MLTPKALAVHRRDLTLARNHLAFLERCASDPAPWMPSSLRATPDMIAAAQAKVADLERWLANNTPQLPLFD